MIGHIDCGQDDGFAGGEVLDFDRVPVGAGIGHCLELPQSWSEARHGSERCTRAVTPRSAAIAMGCDVKLSFDRTATKQVGGRSAASEVPRGCDLAGSQAGGQTLLRMHKPKPYRCSICGAVVPDLPTPVLKHQMSHVRRRPFARHRPEPAQSPRKDNEAPRHPTPVFHEKCEKRPV
jgi:hypothetical protein